MRKFFSQVTTRVKGLHVRRDQYPRTALRALGEGIISNFVQEYTFLVYPSFF